MVHSQARLLSGSLLGALQSLDKASGHRACSDVVQTPGAGAPRSIILHRKHKMLWSAQGCGWWGPEPVGYSWPIYLGLVHARPLCTEEEVSEAAFEMPLKGKRGAY